MTRARTANRGCARYEPQHRNIYLYELDELCDLLCADGHDQLAARIRVTVTEHERASLMKPTSRAPTIARFEPTLTERRPLTAALAEVRKAWAHG